MKLALVVPALNEEAAIADTLRRVLAAKPRIIEQTAVTEVTCVFVNDGSTDGTQQVVDQPEFDSVVKVHFVKNQGYGAAIKMGWKAVDADLLGFLDADGTCDPGVCVDLVNRLTESQADVVIAARLTPESKMPLIRRIGNIMFARLLGLVSGRALTDSASGFRILKRSSLKYMWPLPDGLHFTPAMSATCLMDRRLKIEEVPFTYQERVGRSKLSVIRDGIRFLYVILFTACCYNPIKTMLGLSVVGLAMSMLLAGVSNALTGSTSATLPILAVWACTTLLMVATGVICHQLNFFLLGPRRRLSVIERTMQHSLHHYRLVVTGLAILVLSMTGVALAPWLSGVSATGQLVMMITLGLVAAFGTSIALGGAVTRVIWRIGERQRALLGEDVVVSSADRISTDSPHSADTSDPHTHWTESIGQKLLAGGPAKQ